MTAKRSVSRKDLYALTKQRNSSAIIEVGGRRVIRIFINSNPADPQSRVDWKTVQIPIPCPASFLCQLLQLKPTIASVTSNTYRIVETKNSSDIRLLNDEDVNTIIDSWPTDNRDLYKLVYKDPAKMKKVLRIILDDDMTKTVSISYDTTAQAVFSMLARKMKMIDTANYRIIVYIKEAEVPQRVLDRNENMFDLLSKLTESNEKYEFYFRDPLAPIRKGSLEIISVPYAIPELPRFEILSLLGQGGFGKVWKVRDTSSGEISALKVMRKHKVVEREMVIHTNVELQVMKDLAHPFVVQLYYSAQTSERLYLDMEFLEGGSLFDLIRNSPGPFSEQDSRFYGAQIILALENLHDNKFVYRDLKLENILLDRDGNLRLTDFGLSHYDPGAKGIKSFSGTAIYLAPEILQNKLHGPTVDWWCFGVAMFLLLCQEPPFWHESHKELFEEIKTKEPYWEDHTYLSAEATSLLKSLLIKDPDHRLGNRGVQELKNHPFFASVDWNAVLAKQYKPPFVPTLSKRHSVNIPKGDLHDIFIDKEAHEVEPEFFSNFSSVFVNNETDHETKVEVKQENKYESKQESEHDSSHYSESHESDDLDHASDSSDDSQ